MNVIIIENEKETRESLSKLLRLFCTNVNIVGVTDNPFEGLKIIQNSDPDLIFLDEEMLQSSGALLNLKASKKKFYVVLLTHENPSYEMPGKEAMVFEYLVKPIDPIALEKCVKDIRTLFKRQLCPDYVNTKKGRKGEDERIGIPTSKGTLFVSLEQIVFLRANNNYTEIILETGKPLLVSKSLKSFERLLESASFMRVHQSYMINLEKVVELQRTDGGALVLSNNDKVPISRAHKVEIKNRLEEMWKIV